MISVHPIAGKELGQQVIAQAMAKQAEAPKSDKSEKKKAKQEPMGSKGRNISRKSREHVLGDERERKCDRVVLTFSRQSKCMSESCGSPRLGDGLLSDFVTLQNMSHVLTLEVMQDLDA